MKESASSTVQTEYKMSDSIVKVTGESNIFLIQETSDEKYELIFGDGIFGKKLESGNVIKATYIKTNGAEGNGASSFIFVGSIKDESGASVSGTRAYMRTLIASENGDDIESVQSIRNYAPRRLSLIHI